MILLEMDAEARLWFFVSAGSEWVAGLEPAKRLMAAKGVANVAVFASTTTDWEFRPMPSAGIFERFTRLDDLAVARQAVRASGWPSSARSSRAMTGASGSSRAQAAHALWSSFRCAATVGSASAPKRGDDGRHGEDRPDRAHEREGVAHHVVDQQPPADASRRLRPPPLPARAHEPIGTARPRSPCPPFGRPRT